MTNPDVIVAGSGEEVTLIRVLDPVYNDYDELDTDASTIEEVTIKAILSNPSEEQLKSLAGRATSASVAATVRSDLDIDPNRPGRPDRIRARGNLYKVAELIEVEHPFASGIAKQQALLEHKPGRE